MPNFNAQYENVKIERVFSLLRVQGWSLTLMKWILNKWNMSDAAQSQPHVNANLLVLIY